MAPTYFAAIVLLAGFFSSTRGVITWQVVLTVFGAAAAVSLPALGGAAISPATAMLPFVLYRAYVERDRQTFGTLSVPSVYLASLMLWAVLAATLMPRLFEGQVQVFAVDRASVAGVIALSPLRPVSGNLTQSAYALGDLAVFLAVRGLLRREDRLVVFQDAVLLLSVIDIAAAFIDLAEHAGLPPVLELVRTAGFTVFTGVETGGLARIQGTFAEASAFGGFTLPLFAFSFYLWQHRVRATYSGAVAFVSLTLLLISTSGTAYVGLAAYGAYIAFNVLSDLLRHRPIPRAGSIVLGVAVALLVIGSVAVFVPVVSARVSEFFEMTTVGKVGSESGRERGSWNEQGWLNFVDTYGLGVGTGSTRVSSYPLVLLSNVGALGFLLFALFMREVLRDRRGEQPSQGNHVAEASRQAVIAMIGPACAAGTIFDLGVATYMFAAAATMSPRYARRAPQAALSVL